jgi:hypothetical protein
MLPSADKGLMRKDGRHLPAAHAKRPIEFPDIAAWDLPRSLIRSVPQLARTVK